jgi:hypothetical protein
MPVPVREIRSDTDPEGPRPVTIAFPDGDVRLDGRVRVGRARATPVPQGQRGPGARRPPTSRREPRLPTLEYPNTVPDLGTVRFGPRAKGVRVVIAGSDKATRRRGMRRQRDPSLFAFGPDLRQARLSAGLSLEAIQDRTGVRRFDIEALEEGDLSRFPDEKMALIAVRRCAETLGLDATIMVQSVGEQWRTATDARASDLVGATRAPTQAPVIRTTGATPRVVSDAPTSATAAVPVNAGGHLSKYPGDASHLRAFTQTAQVPQVAARSVVTSLPPALRFDSTDAIPVTWGGPHQVEPPLGLRVAVWTTVLLLALGVVGVAVHHFRPGWLTKIHLVSGGTSPAPAGSTGGAGHHAVPTVFVTDTTNGPSAASVTVKAPVYSVVVTTGAPCWINVTTPGSTKPVFSSTVPAGTTKTFTSSNGQLTVELGASHALVTAQIFGVTIPHWSLSPQAVPYVMTFHSAPS